MTDYPTEFYDRINDGSKVAARHIVPMIIDLFEPKVLWISVVVLDHG